MTQRFCFDQMAATLHQNLHTDEQVVIAGGVGCLRAEPGYRVHGGGVAAAEDLREVRLLWDPPRLQRLQSLQSVHLHCRGGAHFYLILFIFIFTDYTTSFNFSLAGWLQILQERRGWVWLPGPVWEGMQNLQGEGGKGSSKLQRGISYVM